MALVTARSSGEGFGERKHRGGGAVEERGEQLGFGGVLLLLIRGKREAE
jgi:hypothetical protein